MDLFIFRATCTNPMKPPSKLPILPTRKLPHPKDFLRLELLHGTNTMYPRGTMNASHAPSFINIAQIVNKGSRKFGPRRIIRRCTGTIRSQRNATDGTSIARGCVGVDDGIYLRVMNCSVSASGIIAVVVDCHLTHAEESFQQVVNAFHDFGGCVEV